MPKNRITNRQIIQHVVVWILVEINNAFVNSVSDVFEVGLICGTLEVLSQAFVYYSIGFFFFPKFWKENKVILGLIVVLSYAVYWLFDYLIFDLLYLYLAKIYNIENTNGFVTFPFDLVQYSIIMAFSLSYYFSNNNFNRIREINEKEKLLLKKELNSIKSQFDSHLTLNFLNYCYSHTHNSLKQVAYIIDLYSDFLKQRLLYKKKDKVLLENEIELINCFIKLQQDLNKNIKMDLSNIQNHEKYYILPGLLIAIIEDIYEKINDKKNIIIHLTIIKKHLKLKINYQIKSIGTNLELFRLSSELMELLNTFYKNKHIINYSARGSLYIELNTL